MFRISQDFEHVLQYKLFHLHEIGNFDFVSRRKEIFISAFSLCVTCSNSAFRWFFSEAVKVYFLTFCEDFLRYFETAHTL